jgi:hypothetical protein
MKHITVTRPTRSISRLAGRTFVIVLMLSLATASAALAEPLFLPVGATFTGTGGVEITNVFGANIECEADTSSGEIRSATLVGGVKIDFTGCKALTSQDEECTVKSVGASTEGLILTNTLHGVLGLILPKGTGTGVGLLLLPATGKRFYTITATKCNEEQVITGNVAGEVKPVDVHTLKGTLVFQGKGGVASIKDFDLSTGGLVRPELEAFGRTISIERIETITYSAPVEVS